MKYHTNCAVNLIRLRFKIIIIIKKKTAFQILQIMTSHAANCELGGHLVEEADIQRLLCVESHIKVNLAPSALVLQSANLLSV